MQDIDRRAFTLAIATARKQLRDYRFARKNNPAAFGHSACGAMDGTCANEGPAYVIGVHDGQFIILWGFHKHAWASRFHWCVGKASDARGERTDPALTIDLRRLPYQELIAKVESADNYFDAIIDVIEASMRDKLPLANFTLDKAEAA